MSPHYTASLFREAATCLERCCRIAEGLPVAVLDGDSETVLFLDAPRVLQALANIAGSLDPEGATIESETVDLSELDQDGTTVLQPPKEN